MVTILTTDCVCVCVAIVLPVPVKKRSGDWQKKLMLQRLGLCVQVEYSA